ncbi:MAG: VOC family protein [Caulobacterales bacterium]
MSRPLIFQRHRASHIAVVTRDFDRVLDHWVKLVRAGPFFVSRYENHYEYRGRPATCLTKVAFGYWKDMQIQVVTQLCDTPSIYTEVLDERDKTATFHHVLTLTDDLDADMAHYAAHGIQPAAYFAPSEMRIAFMDTIPVLGLMMEIYQVQPRLLAFFKAAHKAHQEWDGRDPVRAHPLRIESSLPD